VSATVPDPVVQRLARSHRQFLAFLERRVGSRAAAEDILQEAFVRGMRRADTLRSEESAVAWFYRLLRNAITDHYRRRGAERRALERLAAEPAARAIPEAEPSLDRIAEDELTDAVCRCVRSLVDTLKPEYAAALRRIDLDGLTPAAYAREAGITANNAGVRVHRARLALRRQVEKSCGTCATHGCFDCQCGGAHDAPASC
jgi:RNA polymerase sigma factor (sigma-70 family)